MDTIDVKNLAERIDIVLDILVAGDYNSAINNLEILKAELAVLSESAHSASTNNIETPREV